MAFDFPDSPTLDQIVSGPAGQQFQWDGTKWIALGGGGGGGGGGGNPTNPGSTPPSNPTEGMLWYDTVNDILNVWNGSAWAPVGGGSGAFLPINNPTFTGTMTGGGIVVNAIQVNGGPITVPDATAGDQATNLAQVQALIAAGGGGGGGPFLPVSNPAFQGQLTGPSASMAFGVNVTDPINPSNGVFLSSNGNVQATGVGIFTGTVSGADAAQPTNFVTLEQLEAATGGGGGPFLPVNNPTFTGTMLGPSFTASATGIGTAGNLSVGSGTSNISLDGNIATDTTIGSGNALVVSVRGFPMIRVDAATGVVQLGTFTGPTSSAVAFQIDANGNVLLNRNATFSLGATTLAQMNAADAGPWQTLASPTPPAGWTLETPILYRSLAGGKLVEVNCYMFNSGGGPTFFQIIGILPAGYRPNVGGDNWVNGGMCFANDSGGNPAVASTQLTNSGQLVWQSTVTGVNLGAVWFDAIFPVGNIAAGQ